MRKVIKWVWFLGFAVLSFISSLVYFLTLRFSVNNANVSEGQAYFVTVLIVVVGSVLGFVVGDRESLVSSAKKTFRYGGLFVGLIIGVALLFALPFLLISSYYGLVSQFGLGLVALAPIICPFIGYLSGKKRDELNAMRTGSVS